MPRKRRNLCPSCRTEVKEPYKTWQSVVPFPRREGENVGMYEGPSIGRSSEE